MAGKVTKTSKEYLDEVNAVWGENSFELVTEYQGAKSQITLRHVSCGTEITKRADSFKRAACDHCRKTNPLNLQKALEKRKETTLERYGVEYAMQSEEIKQRQLDTLKIKSANYTNEKNKNDLIIEISEKFLQEINSIWGENSFELITTFQGLNQPITLKHISCGNEITKNAKLFKEFDCPYCHKIVKEAKKRMKTSEEYLAEVNAIWGENAFELVTEYQGSKNKITLRHTRCGNEITKRAENFKRLECDYCRTSPENMQKRNEKSKITNLERYGVEYASQSKEFQDKVKQTCLDKYGVESSLQAEEVKEKIKATNLKRYGVEYVSQSQEFKDKVKHTCLDKYGATCSLHGEEIKEKVKATNLERYGVEYASQAEEIKKKISQKNVETWLKQSDENIEDYIIPEKMKEKIINFQNKIGHKPTIEEFLLDTPYKYHSGLSKLIHRLDLWNMFDHNAHISQPENEIYNWIISLNPNIIIERSNQSALKNGKEIDLFFPELNVGIEYCGTYWHSSSLFSAKCNPKPINYHREKMLAAKAQGIHLIQIFESEWKLKEDLIKAKLASYLNLNQNLEKEKIFARKTTIKEISSQEARDFCQQNHIQGYVNGSLRYGLFYKDELVAVMTFIKQKEYYDLSRYCTLLNKQVVGGAAKLLSYFRTQFPTATIQTYADLRWSNPLKNMYLSLGFEYKEDTVPNYYYVNPKDLNLYHRMNFTKQKIKQKFPDIYDDNKTETQMMDELGFLRIHDAGNAKYILK